MIETTEVNFKSFAQCELWIDKIVSHYWEQSKKDFKHNLDLPKIRYKSNITGIAGRAYYGLYLVEFNLLYAIQQKENYIETIVHELVHLLVFKLFPNYKQAHGKEFKLIMNLLGFSGNTYHNYSKQGIKRIKSTISEYELLDL